VHIDTIERGVVDLVKHGCEMIFVKEIIDPDIPIALEGRLLLFGNQLCQLASAHHRQTLRQGNAPYVQPFSVEKPISENGVLLKRFGAERAV
jgi:hypothetical protein